MVWLAFSIALLSQEQVQTCGEELGKWVCRTPAPLDYGSPQRATRDGLAAGAALGAAMRPRSADERNAMLRQCARTRWWETLCTSAEEREGRALLEADARTATLRQSVLDHLSEGRCEEAIRAALSGGDLSLAREARDFCQP